MANLDLYPQWFAEDRQEEGQASFYFHGYTKDGEYAFFGFHNVKDEAEAFAFGMELVAAHVTHEAYIEDDEQGRAWQWLEERSAFGWELIAKDEV